MKYMQNGGFQNHPLMRLTLAFTLLFLVGLWATNFMMYFSKMALTKASIVHYYLGSEADFTLPRTYQSMLEVTHFHLPMMAVVILLLTHLVIFAPFPNGVKVGVIATSFLSGFLNEGSDWLIRFVNPNFAYLKIACFISFQVMLAFLIISLGWFLYSGRAKKAKN